MPRATTSRSTLWSSCLPLAVHLEDRHPLGQDRQGDGDLAIEAPRSQQSGIEDFRAVRRRHHDDPGGRVEAVHLGRQLIERLLALVVGDDGARPDATSPMASISSMKMIAGARLRASANRSRTRAAPTPTNISTKLDPVTEKKGTLASPATARAKQRLAGARRADHQNAPGRHGAGLGVALGLMEEVDHLADLYLGALVTGHVGEGRARALLVEDLRL